MKTMNTRIKPALRSLAWTVLLALGAQLNAQAAPATVTALSSSESERLVVLGTAIGELVYAFDRGDSIVARDLSCEFPSEIQAKPAVGYYRQIAAEGVLAVQPSAILSTEAAGPPTAMKQLKASGLPVHTFSATADIGSLRSNIAKMGQVLDDAERAKQLLEQLDADLAGIPEAPEASASVLFLLSPPGSDRLLAAGAGTAADKMIHLAGGTNAFADLSGYQPIASELIAARRPSIVLLPSADSVASDESTVGHTAIDRLVTRGESRIVRIDLAETLAFGIRTGSAAARLHQAFYP